MFIFQHFLRFQNKSFCFPTFQNCSDSGTLLCFFLMSWCHLTSISVKYSVKLSSFFVRVYHYWLQNVPFPFFRFFFVDIIWKVGVSGVGGMFVSKICYLRLENILYRPTNAIILQILMLIYFWISYVKIPIQVLRFRFLFLSQIFKVVCVLQIKPREIFGICTGSLEDTIYPKIKTSVVMMNFYTISFGNNK